MVDGHAAAMEMQPLMTRQPDEWEFPRDRLTITTVLGAGAFGVVMRGLAQGIKGSVGQITVAVKTVRGEIWKLGFIFYFINTHHLIEWFHHHYVWENHVLSK